MPTDDTASTPEAAFPDPLAEARAAGYEMLHEVDGPRLRAMAHYVRSQYEQMPEGPGRELARKMIHEIDKTEYLRKRGER